jgi:iron complex outermembrane recepter protein
LLHIAYVCFPIDIATYTMKKTLTILCCTVLNVSFAQNSLTGKVTAAEDLSEVIGASVYIPDLKRGAVTDKNGIYSITGLPKGNFLIECKFIGYATLVKSVQLSGAVELNLTLNGLVTELNEVVVTGMSHSSELKSNPIPVATLDNRSLTENMATNLIDNISKKAGVSQISTGPAISKPVIRGLGYNRIILLNNGIRQEGQQWGDEHGIEIDEFSVDRVEIVKGAGSLMYGSDGIGGVINFLAANPVSAGTITGKWISNYQTNNGLFANSLTNSGNIKGVYWQARVSNKTARPYSNAYDGKVFNSGFQETDVNGFLGVSKAWGYSQLNINSFNQSLGLVEGERDTNGNFIRLKNVNGVEEEVTATTKDLKTYSLFIPNQNIHHLGISNTTNLYLGDTRLQFNGGYQRNQRKEYGDVLNENTESLYFDLTSLNYNLTYFLPEKKDWQVSLGTSGMSQNNRNRGIEFLIPEYGLFDAGLFGFAKRHFEKLDLSGGIRFDQRKISIDPLFLDENGKPTLDKTQTKKFETGDLSFSNYSASAGATYKMSDQLSAKSNISRGFRAPNISELTSNGRHEGTLRYEYGNYDLKAETSLQMDVGLSFNSKHISADISLFQNTIDHYIFTEKLLAKNGMDSIPDPGEPVPAYHYVQGKASLTGGELSIDVHPHPLDWLHFENSFSFVNAINKSQSGNDSARYLPFIPAPRFQSEVRANFKKEADILANFFVKLEFHHTWLQDRALLDNRSETTTPSYSIWNAGLGTDVKKTNGSTLFTFYFTINNILDVAYQSHLSRLKYAAENVVTGRTGVFNMGRNFSFKIIVPLTFNKQT